MEEQPSCSDMEHCGAEAVESSSCSKDGAADALRSESRLSSATLPVAGQASSASTGEHSASAGGCGKQGRCQRGAAPAGASCLPRGPARYVVPEDPPLLGSVGAAARQALISVPHEMLVAAFTRIETGIERYRLATIAEAPLAGQAQSETCSEEEEEAEEQAGSCSHALTAAAGPWQRGARGGVGPGDEGPVQDNTFMTGVGIMDSLEEQEEAAPAEQRWEDPTERIAAALGMDINLLAHKSGRVVGGSTAALAHLRLGRTRRVLEG